MKSNFAERKKTNDRYIKWKEAKRACYYTGKRMRTGSYDARMKIKAKTENGTHLVLDRIKITMHEMTQAATRLSKYVRQPVSSQSWEKSSSEHHANGYDNFA